VVRKTASVIVFKVSPIVCKLTAFGKAGVLTIYMGKPEIPVGKLNGSRHPIWEASENMGCDLRRYYYPLLKSLSS